MGTPTLFLPELTPPLRYAQQYLTQSGVRFCGCVSEADYILLPIPSNVSADLWKELQETSKENSMIIGGNLPAAGAARKTSDLLKDPSYLAENAAITAHCALSIVMQHLPITLQSCQVLIIGWGRIGAALAEDLKKNGAQVTVCSGTERSRSLCMALGYGVFPPEQASVQLPYFRVIVNTAPAVTISDFSSAQKNCLFIDLASKPGIIAPEVIAAKGLPGKMVPESSGKLIAKAVQHIIFGKE